MGSGALSATEAPRNVTVEVADDDEAYLAFNTDLGNSPDNNYEYASIEDGELTIDFDSNSAGGQGVNPNAISYFDDVFGIENQGTEPLKVWVTLQGDLADYADVYPIAGNWSRDDTMVGESNAVSASWATGVGSGFRVGIEIDLRDEDVDGLLQGTITIHADDIDPS